MHCVRYASALHKRKGENVAFATPAAAIAAIDQMKSCGMDYDDIAAKTGLDRATLWRIRAGESRPRRSTIKLLQNAADTAAKNRRRRIREAQ